MYLTTIKHVNKPRRPTTTSNFKLLLLYFEKINFTVLVLNLFKFVCFLF